ncbi:GreA/GreB family elongation factor [Paenibacillus hamazuiensis]|uniref:GreA/GreB family elongation factor n=1 Tax=Paenibacillus hamazuiensis TaxID=2936508 RepID=UPI0020109CC3|nr:GreA/GreB family elongation factor [Paenibacillus hamazuiensis]
MNPSFNALGATRRHLISQLVFFDEQTHHFADMYLSGIKNPERNLVETSIKQYTEKLMSILENDDRILDEMLRNVVLIGSKAEVLFEDDGSSESFTVVHPSESDPDANRISFISPIGRQLLCAKPDCPLLLETPAGEHPVRIREIKYTYIGGFQIE